MESIEMHTPEKCAVITNATHKPTLASGNFPMTIRKIVREIIPFVSKRFDNSTQYWVDRYKWGGNSGKGSRGEVAHAKANFINSFCSEKKITAVVEHGSGDGLCASLINVEKYIGLDISDMAIDAAKRRCADTSRYTFLNILRIPKKDIQNFVDAKIGNLPRVSISMDVIFHLIEDEVFFEYLEKLQSTTEKYIIVYSSDIDLYGAAHVKHRHYSKIFMDKYNIKLMYSENTNNVMHFKVFEKSNET